MPAQLLLNESDCEQGGKDSIEDDFAFKNNVFQANKEIRLGFIRKVYTLLSIQLVSTIAIGAVFSYVDPVKLYIQQNAWTLYIAIILSLVLLIPLHIYRRDSPLNLILLAAFTVVEAYSIGVLVSFFDQQIVIQALFLTFAVVLGITIYTFNSQRDFSSMHSALFACLLVLIIAGFLQLFFNNTVYELCISIFGAIVFSLFIIYDTHMLMQKLSAEEYIHATISLYLDIINLFIYILRILQASRN